MKTSRLAPLALGGLALAGCKQPYYPVDRVDPETVVDYDYRFDDEDSNKVAHDMTSDALSRQWIENWSSSNGGKKPIVFVGTIRNETGDYIDTKMFTKQFERELINSGRVRLVAMRDERGELRDERAQGQEFNRPETIKKLGNELGADYMLLGRVGQIKQSKPSGTGLTNFYQVDLELVDIESNEKVWIGNSQIKKVARLR